MICLWVHVNEHIISEGRWCTRKAILIRASESLHHHSAFLRVFSCQSRNTRLNATIWARCWALSNGIVTGASPTVRFVLEFAIKKRRGGWMHVVRECQHSDDITPSAWEILVNKISSMIPTFSTDRADIHHRVFVTFINHIARYQKLNYSTIASCIISVNNMPFKNQSTRPSWVSMV